MSKTPVPSFMNELGEDDLASGTHAVRHECVDCGALSPNEHGDNTLISMKYGWRLSRTPDGAGGHRFDWHCKSCWNKAKQAVSAKR